MSAFSDNILAPNQIGVAMVCCAEPDSAEDAVQRRKITNDCRGGEIKLHCKPTIVTKCILADGDIPYPVIKPIECARAAFILTTREGGVGASDEVLRLLLNILVCR